MKKFNSLDDLSSLIPKDYKSIPQVEVESNTPKQHLEAHYSVKGRAGTPVIIKKGFNGVNKDELKKLSKSIKTDLELEEVLRIMRFTFRVTKEIKLFQF